MKTTFFFVAMITLLFAGCVSQSNLTAYSTYVRIEDSKEKVIKTAKEIGKELKEFVDVFYLNLSKERNARVHQLHFAAKEFTKVADKELDNFNTAADTEESTPPERPRMTFSVPTCWRISSTARVTKDFIDHDFLHRQTLKRKLASIFLPSLV